MKMTLGYKFLDLGRGLEANRMFNKALLIRPLFPDGVVAAVVSSLESGQESLSLQLLQSNSVERYRGDEQLEYLVARVLNSPESAVIREFLTLTFESDPINSSRYLNLMLLSGYDLHDLRNYLPLRSETIKAYGDILLADGDRDSAEIAYIEAISLSSRDNSNVTTFIHVAEYFMSAEKLSKALVVVLSGLELFPDNSKLHSMVAELTARNGPKEI
ncbi:MAG: hypothetical protein KAU27_11145 [Desulfuromonadales bacterium]|nr:hypothetical protein [Desulfuromonadales bacterium]